MCGGANTMAADCNGEHDVVLGSMTCRHEFDRRLGDVTGDGMVDNNDLGAIASELTLSAQTGFPPPSADANGDGTVAAMDLTPAKRANGHRPRSSLPIG